MNIDIGEKQTYPYKADIYVQIKFIIELDPLSSHKSDRQKNKDEWRDTNIFNRYQVRTVRLDPDAVNEDGKGMDLTGQEIVHQLNAEKYKR